jgi:hypothetical protein
MRTTSRSCPVALVDAHIALWQYEPRITWMLQATRASRRSCERPLKTRAIARCPVPVVTALGHATDRTVADLAAWESHPTPSAAAASLVARAESFVRDQEAAAAVEQHKEQLARARHRARWAVAVAVLLAILVVVVVFA